MSNVIELNDNNFDEEVVKSSEPVLVDFWAEWCGPCKMIAPSVENISNEYAGKLKVGKLDVDSNPNVSSTYGIRSIPTLLIFKNGAPVDQIVGAVGQNIIEAKVDNHI
ncbi:MAG: thioredoxin [Dehalococcoidia bacterium]|nr:thioredoxin [Dehalococcoidia bacterium]MEC7920991.1 thioredoxin [Chloroflexota bacterium]|tara:strand:+ start:6800 stop:7123 length:324 start_codon:yes stop_codon:yes gene_type:complete